MTDLVKLKERASEAFAKGRFAKAGELYEDYCKASPKDLQSRLRMGDAWARAHQKDRAIAAYHGAAEGFARDGFLPRAIAASKLILELDPAHQGVQQMLADLYARRGFGDSGGRRAGPGARPATPAGGTAPSSPVPARPREIEVPEDDAPISEPAGGAPIALGPPEEPVVASSPEPAPAAPTPAPKPVAPRSAQAEPPPRASPSQPTGTERPLSAEPPPAPAADRATRVERPQPAAKPAQPKAAGPKVHTIELDPDADELSFADAAAGHGADEPFADDSVGSSAEASAAIEIEVESAATSIGDSLESVASTVELELPDEALEAPVQAKVEARPAPPAAPKSGYAAPSPVRPAPPSNPPATAKAVPSSASVPLEVDEAEVATEILGKLEVPRPKVPGPPPPPSRIVSSGHVAPPGLRRRTDGELPPPKAAAPRPRADRPGRSELRASLAAFSAFDELDPGFDPLPPPSTDPTSTLPAVEANTAFSGAEETGSAGADAEASFAEVEAPTPAPQRAAGARPRASWDTSGFTELELTGDSLLHAVELAAHQAGSEAAEEPVPEEAPQEGALPQIPLFSDLPHEAFIALFERSPLRRLGMGERIITQGSVGDAFYVICEGAVRVVREDNGQTRELAQLGHGSFFGEMALLSGAPRTASVESAADDTQLLEISAPVLAELSKDHPQIATALRKFCRQRMLSNVMESSALFRPFGKRDRRALIERFRAREVKPGELVIHEGQRSDGLYVVLSGEVEVRKQTQVLAQLKEGELFGEMSLLEKAPASATVRALKRTSLLRLPREDFDALILSHPQILVLVSELTEDRRRRNEALTRAAPPAMPEGDEPLVMV